MEDKKYFNNADEFFDKEALIPETLEGVAGGKCDYEPYYPDPADIGKYVEYCHTCGHVLTYIGAFKVKNGTCWKYQCDACGKESRRYHH